MEDFLQAASSAVPQHSHHDNVIEGEDDGGTTPQDPSDIPSSLRFCEIRLLAPDNTDQVQPLSHTVGAGPENFTTLLPISSHRNEDASIFIESIQEIEDVGTITLSTPATCLPKDISDPEPCPLRKEQIGCTDCSSEKELVTLENAWPSASSQGNNYILSTPSAVTIELPHPIENGTSYHQSQSGMTIDHFEPSFSANKEPYDHSEEAVHHQDVNPHNLQLEGSEVHLTDSKNEMFLYYSKS